MGWLFGAPLVGAFFMGAFLWALFHAHAFPAITRRRRR
jgi:hypothetical protein